MKRRITLSIAFILIVVLVSWTRSDSTAEAQNQMRFVADTGVITVGLNQELRLTVAAGDVNGDDKIQVRFRRIKYIEQGNIYKVESQTTSPAITLAPDEAAVVNGADLGIWRLMVLSSNRNVRVMGIVFDTSTQRVVTSFVLEIQG